MSLRTDPQRVRRWQDEVARDPGSPAFLPLAETYRREGRLDVARRLCLRGLERNPENVEAHFLLGRLYRESGERDLAFDEWDIALRLDPEHREARRALGYLCLERREWVGAVRHLEAVAVAEPDDDRVASLLALARRNAAGTGAAPVELDPRQLAAALALPFDHFVREARVRLVLLVDGAGRVLAQHGFSRELDIAAFASLGAAIHAASRSLARMLGQPGFRQLYQGRGDRQLLLGPVTAPGGELILLTVFGAETTLGLVRVCFQALAERLGELALPVVLPSGRESAGAFDARLAAGLERVGERSRTLP